MLAPQFLSSAISNFGLLSALDLLLPSPAEIGPIGLVGDRLVLGSVDVGRRSVRSGGNIPIGVLSELPSRQFFTWIGHELSQLIIGRAMNYFDPCSPRALIAK